MSVAYNGKVSYESCKRIYLINEDMEGREGRGSGKVDELILLSQATASKLRYFTSIVNGVSYKGQLDVNGTTHQAVYEDCLEATRC